MNSLARRAGLLLLATLLTACQHPATPPAETHANLCQPDSDAASAACHWTAQMQHQLNQQFHDAKRYAGQQCLVRLEWQRSGRYAVTQTQGDETLCLRAWQLLGQSQHLPPPPEPGQPAWFGFAPGHPAATGAG